MNIERSISMRRRKRMNYREIILNWIMNYSLFKRLRRVEEILMVLKGKWKMMIMLIWRVS